MLDKKVKELREEFLLKLFYGGQDSYKIFNSDSFPRKEYPEDAWLTIYGRKDRIKKYQEAYSNQKEKKFKEDYDFLDDEACTGSDDFPLPECNYCSLYSKCDANIEEKISKMRKKNEHIVAVTLELRRINFLRASGRKTKWDGNKVEERSSRWWEVEWAGGNKNES